MKVLTGEADDGALVDRGKDPAAKAPATHALWVADLSDDAISVLIEVRVDPRHDALDALMDD
jgi:hypothetical protein